MISKGPLLLLLSCFLQFGVEGHLFVIVIASRVSFNFMIVVFFVHFPIDLRLLFIVLA